jgi:hypothetical protein
MRIEVWRENILHLGKVGSEANELGPGSHTVAHFGITGVQFLSISTSKLADRSGRAD